MDVKTCTERDRGTVLSACKEALHHRGRGTSEKGEPVEVELIFHPSMRPGKYRDLPIDAEYEVKEIENEAEDGDSQS
jgi:hypothetical protein